LTEKSTGSVTSGRQARRGWWQCGGGENRVCDRSSVGRVDFGCLIFQSRYSLRNSKWDMICQQKSDGRRGSACLAFIQEWKSQVESRSWMACPNRRNSWQLMEGSPGKSLPWRILLWTNPNSCRHHSV
jgi:hypothetical protein